MSKLTTHGKEIKEKFPDKYEKMVEAMNKSNGKVNNLLGIMLAMSDTTTVDDVIKIASGIGSTQEELEKLQPIVGYSYDNKMWNVQKHGDRNEVLSKRKRLREDRFQQGFKYTFEDTVLYRAMVKFGLFSELENENIWNGKREYSVLNGIRYGHKIADSPYFQSVVLFYHTPKNLRELIIGDVNLNKMWTEQAKIQRQVQQPYSTREKEQHPTTSTDEEWRKFQTTHIIKEFDQLAHMPKDVKEKMDGWIEWYEDGQNRRYYGMEKLPPIVMHTILEGFRYPCEDKTIELIREAFDVMEYIGIGVCWNYVENEVFENDSNGSIKYDENGKAVKKKVYRSANRKEMSYRVGAMLKHISSTMRRFAADIKKGFDVKDVRELVVEDLNGWATAQARGQWQFFERTDAPTEYPDLQKKKKGKRNAKIELSETELMIINKFEAEKKNKEENQNDTEYGS